MGRGVNNMALTWRRYSKIFRMYNKRRVFIEGMAPSEESRRMYSQNHKHPCNGKTELVLTEDFDDGEGWL